MAKQEVYEVMFSTVGILLQPQGAPNKDLSHVKINL
jgi:hypothetical protein